MSLSTRTRLAAAACLLTIVAATAACGNDDDSSSDTTAAATETTAAVTETTAAATETTAAAATEAAASGDMMANFTPMEGAAPANCAPAEGQPIKAAWVFVGPINDGGWTQAHNEGRLTVEKELGTQVVTTYKENVPEGPQAAQVIEDLVKDGNNIIFGTSFGFQDAFAEAASKHANVCFEFATGFKMAANLSQMFGASEDTNYLAGMAAGAASKTGKLGYVAPFPIPEVVRLINAWTLGAQSVNPAVTVQVVFTSTWFDPAKERAAAESLIAAGVDVLGSGQDSPATGEAAKAKGIPWSGYDADQSENFPDIWLTATRYHWGPWEASRVKAALEGTWVPGNYYGNIADGFVSLAPYGKLVTEETRAKIEAKKAELAAKPGTQFTGPIKDQAGKERIAAGAVASYEEKMGMNYFVAGVIGELPKS